MMVTIVPVVADLPAGFDVLRAEALREGHNNMERLAADWSTSACRFDAAGEALLAAFVAQALAGIGGMTVDLADPTALRMRRFYVRLGFRRHGVGRRLADALMAKARDATTCVVVNAGTEQAARFWEALAFVRDERDGHTHARRWLAD